MSQKKMDQHQEKDTSQAPEGRKGVPPFSAPIEEAFTGGTLAKAEPSRETTTLAKSPPPFLLEADEAETQGSASVPPFTEPIIPWGPKRRKQPRPVQPRPRRRPASPPAVAPFTIPIDAWRPRTHRRPRPIRPRPHRPAGQRPGLNQVLGDILLFVGLMVSLVALGAAFRTLQRQTAALGTPVALTSLDENPDFLPLVLPAEPTPTPSPVPPAAALPTAAISTLPSAPPTPTPVPVIPKRIRIPAIELDAPVVPVEPKLISVEGQTFRQYLPPENAAGWQPDSAPLGQPGNTVLIGHHNIAGEVFRDLYRLDTGAEIFLEGSDGRTYAYWVAQGVLLPEKGEPLSVRLDNARWLAPSSDERLTLVTCWPYESNTHRLIVVALPKSNPTLLP